MQKAVDLIGTGETIQDAVTEAQAAILAACGAGLSDVVRVGIVMRDLQHDRPVFDEVWVERFGELRPVRATIQSPAFGRWGEQARFMVEVAAYRG